MSSNKPTEQTDSEKKTPGGPPKPSLAVNLLQVSFNLAGDAAGLAVGTAYNMTVTAMGTTAGAATAAATNTAGLLASFVVRVVLGDTAASVVSLTSRAAAVSASAAVQSSVVTAGSLFGFILTVGTSLIIRTTGSVLIYTGQTIAEAVAARGRTDPTAQDGFNWKVVDPSVRVTACETEDGGVIVSLEPADGTDGAGDDASGAADSSYALVDVSDCGIDYQIPFVDSTIPSVPVSSAGASLADPSLPSVEPASSAIHPAPTVNVDTTPAPSGDEGILEYSPVFSGLPVIPSTPVEESAAVSALAGVILEHRSVGTLLEGDWSPAAWDPTAGCFIVPVGYPSGDVELRARAAVV